MKNFIFITTALLTSQSIMGQSLPYEPHGQIKSLTYKEYNISKNSDSGIVYNSLTTLTKIYNLNDQNRIGEIIEHEIDGSFYGTTTFKYDSVGNLVEEVAQNKYGETNSKESIYNENSELVRENRYKNKVLIEYYVFYYKSGKLTKKENFNSLGKELTIYLYRYDSNNNKIKTTWQSNGQEQYEEFEYDDLNRKVSYTLFADSKYTYSYYSNGQVKTESFFKKNIIEWKREIEYDSNQNITKIIQHDFHSDKRRISVYTNKYDEQRNLIEKIYAENGELKYSEVYLLEYK